MTREEAIKIIDCYDIGFCDLSGEKIPADKLAEAFDMAIEALRDKSKGEWILVKGSDGKDYHKCSKCLHTQEIIGVKNYCAVCGARMKGGDDE